MTLQTLGRVFLGAAITLTVALSAAHAGGDKGHGHGKKDRDHHEDQDRRGHDNDRDVNVDVSINFGSDRRAIISDYYQSVKPCPPGLAKKHNGCRPPGQAKKSYVIGRPLPGGYEPLPPVLMQRMPPPPRGYVYGYVDGDVLMIAEATHRVVDAVVAVNAAMNAISR